MGKFRLEIVTTTGRGEEVPMSGSNLNSVDEYLAAQPETVRVLLECVRKTIREAVPDAEEVMSYKMPTYKVHDRVVLHFAGWNRHYSLYPVTEPVIAAFSKDLAPYEVNEKGTVRFPLTQPIPAKLIGRIAKFRAKEAARHDTVLSSSSKKSRIG